MKQFWSIIMQYKVLGRITYHYKIWPSSCEHILFLPFFYISSSFISGWLLCNVLLLFVAAVMCCSSGWACTANVNSGIEFHFKYWRTYLLFITQITLSWIIFSHWYIIYLLIVNRVLKLNYRMIIVVSYLIRGYQFISIPDCTT